MELQTLKAILSRGRGAPNSCFVNRCGVTNIMEKCVDTTYALVESQRVVKVQFGVGETWVR